MKRKYYLIRIFIFLLLVEILYLVYFRNRNHAPTAVPDEIKVYADHTARLIVLQNDIDSDGDSLSIDSYKGPYAGQIVNMGDHFKYIPNSGFEGVDSLRYCVSDGKKKSNSALVKLNVIKEVSIYFEAENFNKGVDCKPFIIENSDDASSKKYATTPSDIKNSFDDLPSEGGLVYTFELESDSKFEVWLRVKNPKAGFWLIIDNEKPKDCYFYSDPSTWTWKNSGSIFNLTRGEHKIKFVRSKSNTNLDMILLTNVEKSASEIDSLIEEIKLNSVPKNEK